jgi:hypothetical protein
MERLLQVLGLGPCSSGREVRERLAGLGFEWPFPGYPGGKQEPPGLRAVVERLVCEVEALKLGQIEGKLEKIDFIISKIRVSPQRKKPAQDLSLEQLEREITRRLDGKFEQAQEWL